MCNMPELHIPIVNLLERISKLGIDTAAEYYQSDGYVCHSISDIWGKTSPSAEKVNKSCHFAFWNMSGGWLCSHAFKHYEYTMDKQYLKETAFPLIKECVKFYLSNLVEMDGKLVLFPSTSPENRYKIGDSDLAIAKYTTMSQTILMELFGNCIKCCEILGEDPELMDMLRKKIDMLDTVEIDSLGRVMEWDREYDEKDPNHRHISHLYGLFPWDKFTKENRSDLFEACRKSLEIRGDDGTGWSMAWKANLWARLGDGNHALKLIKKGLSLVENNDTIKITEGGTYVNLLGAHPPFQIDSNFGFTSATVQMFMQCTNERIKLLPALPDEFRTGCVKFNKDL